MTDEPKIFYRGVHDYYGRVPSAFWEPMTRFVSFEICTGGKEVLVGTFEQSLWGSFPREAVNTIKTEDLVLVLLEQVAELRAQVAALEMQVGDMSDD